MPSASVSHTVNQLEKQCRDIWLTKNIAEHEDQSENLLCELLKTYIRLRQVPKLFMTLVSCVKDSDWTRTNNGTTKMFPKTFVVNFSECVLCLPAGQALELWRIFLDGTQYSYQNVSVRFPGLVDIFSTVLTHIKLSESDFPTSKQSELKELIKATMHLLQTCCKELSWRVDFLPLCYAWGEVVLTLKLYHNNYINVMDFETEKTLESEELFDISVLHPYLSAKEWSTYLKELDITDQTAAYHLVMLLIQKVRFSHLLCESNVKGVVSSAASYIINYMCQRSEGTENNIYSVLWDTIISWFPVLLPVLDLKGLEKLSRIIIKTVMVETWKSDNSITRSVMKNHFFGESRSLQTALLTCLWDEIARMLVCNKRKSDKENENITTVFKNISRNSKLWHKWSNSKPEDMKDAQENEMWLEVKRSVVVFSCQTDQQFNSDFSLNYILRMLQVLCLFPLEDIEPGNQMRCIIGLLQLLSILKNNKCNQHTELHVLICQALVSLLSKMPVSRLVLFFEADFLMQNVYELVYQCKNPEEEKWSLTLIDKIAYVLISDTSALVKLEVFTKQLCSDDSLGTFDVKVLQSMMKRLLSLSKRYALMNRRQLYQTYDLIIKTLSATLSKKLMSRHDLGESLVWQCLTCILVYQCRTFPDDLQTLKRKPKRYLKHHLRSVEALVSFQSFTDCNKSQSFFALLGIICENRCLFEEHLPENFVLDIWDCILLNMNSNTFNAKQTKELKAIKSLLKSMKPSEVESAIRKLNQFCSRVVSGSTSAHIVNFVPLWNTILSTDFTSQTPKDINTGIVHFLNSLLPLLLKPLYDSLWLSEVVFPTLEFVSEILQKKEIQLKHSQALMCFHACSCLNFSSVEPTNVVTLCTILLKIYKRLLTGEPKVILESVAAFISCLSTVQKEIVRIGKQSYFYHCNENMKKSISFCAEDYSKLLALVANHKTEFCKEIGFLIADYIVEAQEVTIHPLIKEKLLLGVYKVLDICDEHSTSMIQTSLTAGGRQILRQLHSDFNQYYRYKGYV